MNWNVKNEPIRALVNYASWPVMSSEDARKQSAALVELQARGVRMVKRAGAWRRS